MLIKKYFIGLVKYYRGLNDDPEEVLYEQLRKIANQIVC